MASSGESRIGRS